MEVAVVVTIISLLATLVAVGFNSVQKDARDAQVKAGAQKIAEAIELWSIKTRMQPADAGVGWGSSGTLVNNNGVQSCSVSNGGGTGWFGKGSYNCTMEEALVQLGFLEEGYVSSLPPNTKYNTSRYSFMLYKCSASPNNYVLYFTLENPSAQDVKQYDEVAVKRCGNGTGQRTSYNMQSAILIDLSRV